MLSISVIHTGAFKEKYLEEAFSEYSKRISGLAKFEDICLKERLLSDNPTEGEILLDLVGKASGRGAYICKKRECFKVARKRGRLEQSLECKIPDEVYDKLEEEISCGNA